MTIDGGNVYRGREERSLSESSASASGTGKAKGAKRVPHPKVRSGCLTCKKRRVKCDERRPSCLRCEKFGIQCDGYIRPASEVPDPAKAGTRILVPRKRDSSTPPLKAELKRPRFSNDTESRYFRLFCENTAFHLSGYYDPILWGRIVLQASEAEDSIRHAVISIGALDMTTAMMRNSENDIAKAHHLFALKQYSKAIRNMRAMIIRQQEMQDTHSALVASILIVCFETYHGNYSSAAQQIRTGVRLIEDQKRNKDAPAIEEDLARAFDRLDVQSMSHSDPFTIEEHIALKDVYTHRIEDLPPVFVDLKSARDYFNFISRRACHFASMAWKLEHTESKKPSHSFFDPAENNWRVALVGEVEKFIKLSEGWMASFLSIYTRAREEVKIKTTERLGKSVIAPLAMRNHFLCMRLALRHFQDVDEMSWDKSHPFFVEILENAEIVLANSDYAIFSFDLQSVWPLDVVAKKCRVASMRRQAIKLLKDRPRREGIWDSIVAALVCEWVVNVEEEGMLDDGTIPESSRVRNIGVELDSENRQAKVWCYFPSADTNSPFRKREAWLEWGSSRWNGGFEEGWSGAGSPYQPTFEPRDELFEAARCPTGMGVYFGARRALPLAANISTNVGTSIGSCIGSNIQPVNFQEIFHGHSRP